MTERYSRIISTGSYLPERVMTNHDLEKIVETSHDWIVERTGIHSRHIASDDETSSSMGCKAAELALERAGLKADDIDLILVATTTPDKTFPSTACLLQQRLGTRNQPAMDISAACAGFVYGLSVADQYIKTGQAKHVLVVGTETMSRITNWEDRTTCILFADGAGAAIVGPSDEAGILSTHIHADGHYQNLLHCPSPNDPKHEGPCLMQMSGNEVFKLAVNTLSKIVDETLTNNQLEKTDIDWLIPHQANIRIIQAMAKKLNMTLEQVVVTVQEHGNTSAASIPLALDQAVTDGRIQRGQTLLLESFGAGFAWGSALIRY